MTAPTTMTLTLDDELGVVVMHDGEELLGQNVTYTMTDDEQPLNRQTAQNPASKFVWPSTLYAGTVKLHLDVVDGDTSTSFDAELELPTDVNPNLLSGEYEQPEPPPPDPEVEEESTPTSSWLKADIYDWLVAHGHESAELDPLTKDELLARV